MKKINFMSISLFAILLALLFGFSTNTKPIITIGQWICSSESVPKGYVVVSYNSDMACPNWSASGFNTKYIQKPGNSCWICSNSPVPDEYTTTSYGSSMSCPNWSPSSKNTKFIVKVE